MKVVMPICGEFYTYVRMIDWNSFAQNKYIVGCIWFEHWQIKYTYVGWKQQANILFSNYVVSLWQSSV